MRINVNNISATRLFIGFTGENNHLHVAFDCGAVFAEYPEAYGQMEVKPPVGEIYPKALTREGSNLVWDVTASDCANVGDGAYQITFTQGTTVVKSFIGFYTVRESLVAEGEPPEPVEDWLTQVEMALAAFDGLTASAETLPEGSAATATVEMVNGHKNVLFGIPTGATGAQGEQGEQGVPGTDGFSPVVDVTPITGGNRVSITDATGTESFDVMDGADGQDGAPGAPGADGVSPTVAVTPITDGHEVTITDKNGAHTFDVMNGEKGDPGTPGDPTTLIDDTTTTATNKVWSAKKSATEVSTLSSALSAKYTKPASGIPAEDLASGVIPAVPVQDVSVAGTSVLSQGVANVPIGGNNVFGVFGINDGNGISVSGGGNLKTNPASDNQVKAGTEPSRPLCPQKQDMSTFFGLAKAAGADMASLSSVTVGLYPEAQKNAICNMIGTERKMRLLKTIDITTEIGVIGFDTDLNGLPFKVDKIVAYVYMKKASTSSKDLTFGIETTAITSNGSNWVGKVVNFSSATSGVMAKITAERDNFRWTLRSQVDSSTSDDFFDSIWVSSGSGLGRTYLNGASWIRANNPLYATQLSMCITDINFPVGTRFEFYAHDYQG